MLHFSSVVLVFGLAVPIVQGVHHFKELNTVHDLEQLGMVTDLAHGEHERTQERALRRAVTEPSVGIPRANRWSRAQAYLPGIRNDAPGMRQRDPATGLPW
jgi:hypothetical protein